MARCLGCGCVDMRACVGGCHWLVVDDAGKRGVCSSCPHKLLAFHASPPQQRVLLLMADGWYVRQDPIDPRGAGIRHGPRRRAWLRLERPLTDYRNPHPGATVHEMCGARQTLPLRRATWESMPKELYRVRAQDRAIVEYELSAEGLRLVNLARGH